MIKVNNCLAIRIAIGIMLLTSQVSGTEVAYPAPTDVTFQNSTWHWIPVKIVPVKGSGYDDYYPTQQWFGLRSLPASDTVPFTMDTPFNSEAYIEKDFDVTSGASSLSMDVFGARNIDGWCGDPVTVTVSIIDSTNTLHQLGNFIPVQRDGNIGPGETKNFDTSNFGGQRIKVRISQTSSGQHCTYGNYINIKIETLTSPAVIQGIDVSGYQHPKDNPIDWAKVHDTGIEFAFAKADEGTYSVHYTDAYFKTDMEDGKANGILMGAYHFARPVSYSAKDEAEHFISTAKDYLKAGYLRPALDVEKYDYNGISEDPCQKMGKAELSRWVNEWMNIVKDKTGVEPILYTYSDYANRCFDSSVTNRDLWIADFRKVSSPGVKPWQEWAFWQYSDKGKVNGITSDNVDLDKFYGTKFELYNYITTPISTPGPAAIPIDKKETLVPYGGDQRYYIHIYNVDDIAKAIVNGKQIAQINYQQDSGWIDISNYLKDGSNTIELTDENGIYGGWTYGFEIRQDNSNVIWKDSCGTAGTVGCMNNDGTQGLVYRNIITFTGTKITTPTLEVLPLSGPQKTLFQYSGNGYTPTGDVDWHLLKPDGTEYIIKNLLADSSGKISYQYVSTCNDMIGSYNAWTIDRVTEIKSNIVNQIISASSSCTVAPSVPIPAVTAIPKPTHTENPKIIPIDKKEMLGSYGDEHNYYIHVYNVDDIAKAIVNGKLVIQENYQQDSGWVEITDYLKSGDNIIEFTDENSNGNPTYRYWTYGFEIRQDDSNIIWKDSCGTAGNPSVGCKNNDITEGLVYRNELTLKISMRTDVWTGAPEDGNSWYEDLYNWWNTLWFTQSHQDFEKIDGWLREGQFEGKWQIRPGSQQLDWIKDDIGFSLTEGDITTLLNKEIDHDKAPDFTYKNYVKSALYEEDLVNHVFKVSEAYQGSEVVASGTLTRGLALDMTSDITSDIISLVFTYPPRYIIGIYTIIQISSLSDMMTIVKNLDDAYYAAALRAYFYDRGNGCTYQTDEECIKGGWQSAENLFKLSFAGKGISEKEKSIFLDNTKQYFESLWQEYKDKGTYGYGLKDYYRIDSRNQVKQQLISGLEKYHIK